MDFEFNDQQKELRELARKILEDRVTNDRLKEIEAREPVYDAELWAELAKANLLGVAVPEAHGGMGYGFLELCVLLQEVGRSVAPVPALATLVLGALPLARFGSDAQQRAWLPGVVAGDVVLTAALHEPDADEPRSPSTRAHRAHRGQRGDESGHCRLDGVKTAVPAAAQATRILVPAALEGGGVGLFWIDPQGEGVTLTDQTTANRQPHCQVELTGALGEPLGEPSIGAEALEWLVQHATVATCATQLGVSERSLEMTARYTTERQQFDRAIGSFQAVHQRAADAYINVEAIRLTTWEAAWRLADGRSDRDSVEIAKYWAAEGGQYTAYACQHLHGGLGIDVDYPLHRYFIWSIQLEHTLGSARHHLAQIGGRIARKQASPEVAQ